MKTAIVPVSLEYMNPNAEILKLIFSMKLRFIRQKKGMSVQDIKKKSGLSLSYLSEIESGKKYPKADKILLLAEALEVSFEELVSTKVPRQLQPLAELLQSDFFEHFPLDMFGISNQKLVEIFSTNPDKFNAFVKTMIQIGRSYEMRQEHLYNAALRSYQEINNNYFKELENAAEQLRKKYPVLSEMPISPQALQQLLEEHYEVVIDKNEMPDYEALKNIRSYYNKHARTIYINDNLRTEQECFVLARELAFQHLDLNPRPKATPPLEDNNFELLLSNYKASYLAASILIPEKRLVNDLRRLAAMKKLKEENMLHIMRKYRSTPEMMLQRLTNILPEHFNLKNLFFLRFVSDVQSPGEYKLTKELHLSTMHQPHANQLNEHYCRRWISLDIIKEITKAKKVNLNQIKIGAQISQYHETDNEYLIISVGFPNVSYPSQGISVSIGLKISSSVKRKLRFLSDEDIRVRLVNNTCERCSIANCKERVASPHIIEQEEKAKELHDSLERMLNKKIA